VCKVLNKFLVEIEARLFRRNDRVRFLEEKSVKKNKDLIEKSKELKQEELIGAHLRCELKEEKVRVRELQKKIKMIT
ncbi:hypothetical protein KI387_005711, partial [Taxus chinensis]